MYKESYYNFTQTVEDGNMVLYNSRTGAVAVVENKNRENIMAILSDPKDKTGEEFFQPLVDNGFLVPQKENEFEKVRALYEEEFNRKDTITVVLLPAEICNFTCEYCFVWNYAGQIMQPRIYDNIKKYIRRKIEEAGDIGKKIDLRISWFGGEPLLEREAIKRYMKEVIAEFSDTCNVRGDIVTNGYYLTYEMFQELLNLNIRQFQITFDGVKEDHDKTRSLKGGKGSFDVIIKNLKEIVNKVPNTETFNFAIRINFMKHTYKKIYGLIDTLKDIFQEDKRFYVYCRPIYNFETKRDTIEALESNIFSLEEGLQVQTDFTLYIVKLFNQGATVRSVNDYLPMPTSSWCSEDNKHSIIIGADGSVYCCDSLVGDEAVRNGKLLDNGEIEFKPGSEIWTTSIFEAKNFEKCSKCKCLPACMGCCRRERLQGNTDSPCLFTEESIHRTMGKYYNEIYSKGEI